MFTRPKRPTHTIDMAPLIDVVFLLLIFFMLTSSFVPPSLPLALPKASGEPGSPDIAVIVSMDAAGGISIADSLVPADEFETRLALALADADTEIVHFRGDRESSYGRFVDLMDRAKGVGATRFHLIHDARPAEAK